jgi:hypothetical protein
MGRITIGLGERKLPSCGVNATDSPGVAFLRRQKGANVASPRHAAKLARTELTDSCGLQDKCRRVDGFQMDRLSYTDVE